MRAKVVEDRDHYSEIFLELASLVHNLWGVIATFCDFPSYLHYKHICLIDESYYYLVDKAAEILADYLWDNKEGIHVSVQTNDSRHENVVFMYFPTVSSKI